MGKRSEPYRPDAAIVPELAAGAIVVHDPSGEILLLHELEEDRWCFPKGHVDPGESLGAAALREAAVYLARRLWEVEEGGQARPVRTVSVRVERLAGRARHQASLEEFDRRARSGVK